MLMTLMKPANNKIGEAYMKASLTGATGGIGSVAPVNSGKKHKVLCLQQNEQAEAIWKFLKRA
jgi:hypothetical protein